MFCPQIVFKRCSNRHFTLSMSGVRNAKVPKLRCQTTRFLVGQPTSAIPELRLPTGRSVLQYFFHVYDEEGNNRLAATKETVECVMRIWAKAGIKTQLYRNCARKLETLWLQWQDINKLKNRKDDERREEFSRKMDSLWDIAAEGAVQQIMSSSLLGKKEKKEDVEFYLDQRTERKGTMSNIDKKLCKRVEEKKKRESRLERMRASAAAASGGPETDEGGCGDDVGDDTAAPMDTSETYEPPAPRRNKPADTVEVHLPKNILGCRRILQIADRLHISDPKVNDQPGI